MSTGIKRSLATAALALAEPVVLLYALPWLMFLLVAGTVAQRYIGLYQSEKLFFGSFILWLGYVPLPGAYATLGLIALCLITKLLLKSPWEKAQAGVIVTHISVLVLLAGALVTVVCREEGYMVLGPEDTSSTVYDYHLHELAIIKNGNVLLAVPQRALHEGAVITQSLPFSLRIHSYCTNCTISPREHPDATLRGAAEKVDIAAAPLRQEDAENQSGVVCELTGLSQQQNGTYIAAEGLSQSPVIQLEKDRYELVMRHEERAIPFALRLIHFEKSDYPGTDMARSYSSQVAIKDGPLEWSAAIEMNQPLRHSGYTLYQSSFIEKDGKLFTVLAVVKNTGALFPYIAIATLCGGLLLHLGIMFLPRTKT